MKAAKVLLEDLSSTHILSRLLDPSAPYGEYSLVIVGHSLGAAIATLLAFHLRTIYPGLRCYAYSPPGCVLSENASR